MQIIGTKLDSQVKFGFVRVEDIDPESIKNGIREYAPTGLRQEIEVPPSGDVEIAVFGISEERPILTPGGKCSHGVYIPAYTFSYDVNRAPYCSICKPYLMKMKGHADEPARAPETGHDGGASSADEEISSSQDRPADSETN